MKLDGEGIVPNRVNSIETRALRSAPAAPVARRGGESPESATSAANGPGVGVNITGAARGLAALEQQLRALPAVDEARVAAVRQRLEDGSYRVDPQRIADRLLRLEQDLARANPLDDRTLR